MKYLIKNKDGSVHIMTIISDSTTYEAEISKMTQEVQDNIQSYRIIEENEIPEDRTKRDLWAHEDDKLVIKE